MNRRVSFWLLPALPEREQLRARIAELAARFNAPMFEPHVTLYSGELTQDDDVAAAVEAAARAMSPVTLRSTGVAQSEVFTKTLFIEFAAEERLSVASDAIRLRLRVGTPYELKPHLSLLYAELSSTVRAELTREFAPPPPVTFDRLQAIVSAGSIRRREDVEAWRVVAEAPLHAVH
jgi:hypothetical protein